MGEFIGRNQKSGSTMLRTLAEDGVLQVVDPRYSFGKGKPGKAKLYRVSRNY